MSQAGIINVIESNPNIPIFFDGNSGPGASAILNTINILGAVVAAGSTPVATSASGNTVTTNVQISQAIAATDATKIGLAAFNSAQFTVDANGFVSLTGGGLAVDSFQVQANTAPGVNPVSPDAGGLVTVSGAVVANHSVVLETRSRALNAYNLEIQYATSAAATDATKSGVAHFNSAHFSVDANGFVSLTGGGQAIDSFTTDVSGPVAPNGSGNVAFTGATNIFSDGSVANTMRLNVQGTNHALFVGRGTNTAITNLAVGTNGQVLIAATGADPAFATIATNANMNTALGVNSLTLNPYNCAKWIVDPIANLGTHQTIAAAITAASSGETIFIRPAVYTENLTLKAGVNLAAFTCDALTPNVTISGTCTMTTAGTVSISGIRLQTNGAALLSVTGSAASIVNLTNCYLNCTNFTGITFSSSSSSAQINLITCKGDLGTTGIGYHTSTSAGDIVYKFGSLNNSGGSTTDSTNSAGNVYILHTTTTCKFACSSTGTLRCEHSVITVNNFNTPAITTAGTGSSIVELCDFSTGTASAITVGAGTTVNINQNALRSTNASVIANAGTITSNGLTFDGSNVLSIYKTGTWTPAVTFGGGSTGITYSSQVGFYTQIGNQVYVSCRLILSNKGSSTGLAKIINLPISTGASGVGFSMAVAIFSNISIAGFVSVGVICENNSTSCNVFACPATGAATQIQETGFTNTTDIRFTGCYLTV